jgi:hypothetical protein
MTRHRSRARAQPRGPPGWGERGWFGRAGPTRYADGADSGSDRGRRRGGFPDRYGWSDFGQSGWWGPRGAGLMKRSRDRQELTSTDPPLCQQLPPLATHAARGAVGRPSSKPSCEGGDSTTQIQQCPAISSNRTQDFKDGGERRLRYIFQTNEMILQQVSLRCLRSSCSSAPGKKRGFFRGM